MTHEEIVDGSVFHECAREFRYPSNGPEIQDIRNNWFKISHSNGSYAFG